MNHKAGADRKEKCKVIEVDQNGQFFPSIILTSSSLAADRRKDIGEAHEIEAWLGFDFPGRDGKYSKQKYGWEHFSGTDYDAGND